MKKLLFSLSLLVQAASVSYGQTTATNFTAPDCNSTNHTLFNELDNGKVVVLVWIMPCGSCISDAKGAYDAVQSFASSNPGQVLYYLSDDNGGTSCATLNSWANTNAIGLNRTVFGNSGAVINEADYGGSGMPHVVVMGGPNHTIYYNQLDGSNNGPAIQAAISQALATSVTNINTVIEPITVYPNPAKGNLSLSYHLKESSEVSLDVVNATGAIVKALHLGRQKSGKHEITVDLGHTLSSGIYSIQLHSVSGTAHTKFTLAE